MFAHAVRAAARILSPVAVLFKVCSAQHQFEGFEVQLWKLCLAFSSLASSPGTVVN